ncbi:MAG TPA: RNA-binding cell elongation regulator Jag/EloR [Egibacteraceae bacterium]|nr:RNA-binding cell elongation regulator Jag/EloR [Egibacteraceae bacterium]
MTRSVETEGASVEEATERALSELGVTQENASVEVLSEGRRGLFGGNRPARVRVTAVDGEDRNEADASAIESSQGATVTQTDSEVATAGEELSPQDAGDTQPSDAVPPEERMDQLDEEADLAADFVEGLLDLLDLPGDIEIEVQEEQALLNVQEVGSGLLIGRRGATLDALQELVRCAVQRQTERRTHVRVDVEGYRGRQLEKLRDKCRDAIAQVRETGEPVRLEPMDAYERKTMHDLVSKTGGVVSSSEGSEPKRRVVIHPAT